MVAAPKIAKPKRKAPAPPPSDDEEEEEEEYEEPPPLRWTRSRAPPREEYCSSPRYLSQGTQARVLEPPIPRLLVAKVPKPRYLSQGTLASYFPDCSSPKCFYPPSHRITLVGQDFPSPPTCLDLPHFACEIEKHSLSTSASREAPVGKRARRLNAYACGHEFVSLYVRLRMGH